MGLRTWIARLTRAVDTEYDRRIKRASNVAAYGAHGHEHATVADEESDGAVIVNLAPGTPVRSTIRHEAQQQHAAETLAPLPERHIPSALPSLTATDDQNEDESQEAEIVNLPRGASVRPHEA